ncbi:MAG: response regulator [Desulfotalea sp.]
MSNNEKDDVDSRLKALLALSLESTRKSYYPQLHAQLDTARQSEDAFRAQSQLLNTIFDATPSILILLDKNNRILKINKQGLLFTGLKEEELIGLASCDALKCVSRKSAQHKDKSDYCSTCQVYEKTTDTIVNKKSYFEEVVDVNVERRGKLVSFTFLLSSDLIDSVGGGRVLLSLTNITETKLREENLRRQKRAITLNNRIANTFLTSPKEEIFDRTLTAVIRPLLSGAGLFGYLDDNNEFIFPGIWVGSKDYRKRVESSKLDSRIKLSQDLHNILLGGKSAVINKPLNISAGHIQLNCILAVPIVHTKKTIGLFLLANKKGGYTRHDQVLLESAARQTAPILYSHIQEGKIAEAHRVLEEQFRQSQKMESIGRLAGGIAHDLNNLLSPVMGYGEMLVSELEGTENSAIAGQIVKASQRASDLIGQLLSFSRKQSLETKNICLNELLEKFELFLRRTLREDILIWYQKEKNLPRFDADSGQIERIFLNLAVNAQDAMPNGGRLGFSTSIHKRTFEDEVDYLLLKVTDDGIGMSEIVLGQAFEPFFTTKEKNKGTGLGLASVYGIVKQHGGKVEIYSKLDKGTDILIYFPISNKAMPLKCDIAPKKVIDEESQRMTQSKKHILLVEDNKQVRDLAHTILVRQGFDVTVAVDGEDALKLDFNELPEIDLLLTDVIMPGVNGKELYEKLSNILPDIKVVYMSGYTDEVISHQGLTEQGIEFIHKPFGINDFLTTIRKVIGL